MIPSERSYITKVSKWLLWIILIWALWKPITKAPFALGNVPFALDYLSKMIPPDIGIIPMLWIPLLETLQMAVVGTAIGVVIALPLSLLAARNTSPFPIVSRITRLFLAFMRSMPVLVWAMLFVSLAGLGILAGVLGITCHVIGALGKQFYECIEVTAPKIQDMLEAMRIDGATEWQVIRYGLMAEIMPLAMSYTLYRFESVLRTSTIMGLVGAGGLGMELTMALRMFHRQQASTIILVILGFVAVIDWLSVIIRRNLLQGSGYQ